MEPFFRGKDINTKQWIYGWLVVANDPINKGKHFIINGTSDFSYGDNGNRIRIGCFKEVIPETVGRFTGLTDKNGTNIFEHDIILSQEFQTHPYSSKAKLKRLKGTVVYKIGGGSGFYDFKTKTNTRCCYYSAEWGVKFDDEDTSKYSYSSWGDFFDCEVIGNIFDDADIMNANGSDIGNAEKQALQSAT